MPFEPNGSWDGARLAQPIAWNIRAHMVAHHIISRETLCQFWNRLIEQRAAANNAMQLAYLDGAIVSYVQTIGYQGNARRILQLIQNNQVPAEHPLETALCWQRYNVFEGPTANANYGRPVHFPDPATDLDSPLGRCAREHNLRAGRLRRASEYMDAFLAPDGSMSVVHWCLGQLSQVRQLDIIPVYDINWYCLMPQARFTALSLARRQHFFNGCYNAPGALAWRKTPEQVEQAYANAIAAVP
jgi:hypothetical protein